MVTGTSFQGQTIELHHPVRDGRPQRPSRNRLLIGSVSPTSSCSSGSTRTVSDRDSTAQRHRTRPGGRQPDGQSTHAGPPWRRPIGCATWFVIDEGDPNERLRLRPLRDELCEGVHPPRRPSDGRAPAWTNSSRTATACGSPPEFPGSGTTTSVACPSTPNSRCRRPRTTVLRFASRVGSHSFAHDPSRCNCRY